jgi:hypothetical protein
MTFTAVVGELGVVIIHWIIMAGTTVIELDVCQLAMVEIRNGRPSCFKMAADAIN